MRFASPRWLILPLVAMLSYSTGAWAQVSAGGTPPSFKLNLRDQVPSLTLPGPDVGRYMAEDATEEKDGVAMRFGAPVAVDLDMENSGVWSTLPDGTRVWRLRIASPGAYSLNLLYDEFALPAGAEFFLYTDDHNQVLGAFTEYNSACSPDGTFATQPTAGDAVVLEYREPAWAAFQGHLHINSVVHAYRNFFGLVEADRDYGSSGSCENNVNCPEGALWQTEKRGVAMILTSGNSRICTGSMINNAAQDLRQYFLTANHCGLATGSYIFMFNYEAPGCTNVNGPTNQTVQGCTLRANNAASDFTLVELTENIPSTYNVHFAGWNNVDVAATNSTCIHHPSGDIKKISFSNTPTTNDTWSGTPANSHWRATWSDGVTEPGSSGSPLFDQNHRIIGQLHGGPSSCSSQTYDVYGKVSLSWANGSTAATRLKDWLDPANTGITTLNGMDDAPPTTPNMALGAVVVNDGGDGALDPSETPTLVITLSNSGAAASGITGVLSETSPYVTVTDANGAWPNLAMGGSAACTNTFQVSVDPATPAGTSVSFTLVVSATGGYTTTKTFSLVVGLTSEGFETGNFSAYNWSQGGTLPWTVATGTAYQGSYAAKSGAIDHSQSSIMNLGLQVVSDGTMSFAYKVSSESSYDFLTFSLDGTQQGSWSGEVDWAVFSFPITAGAHTCTWTYSKDGSVVSGSDCAWVDEVVLPVLGAPQYPDVAISPVSLSKTLAPGTTGTELLTIANTGTANLTWTASSATVGLQTEVPTLKLAKGEEDPRVGSFDRNAGGPDAFGYRWKDSAEAGGPAYSWVDISTVGTNVGTGDDAILGPFNLGFTFNYYGTAFTSVKVGTNGYLSFTTTSTAYTNQGIPNTTEPNNLLAAFWDDLNVTTAGMLKYYADTANQRFIVSWLAVPRYGVATDLETFQVILYANGRIVYQYNTMVGTLNSATVGIENAGGTTGLQVVFNAAYITNSRAIEFSAQTPWLSLAPTSGSVAAGGSGSSTVSFNATNLTIGTYTGTVTVNSNDPDEATVLVPVTLVVGNPDSQAPSISLNCLGDEWTDQARTVIATITDASGVSAANLLYSVNGGAQQSVAMAASGSLYSANLPGLAAPASVSYQVGATDTNGNSGLSGSCAYTLQVLAVPSIQIAYPTSGQVSLSWTAVTGAASYNVYVANGSNGPWTLLGNTTGTTAVYSIATDEGKVYRVHAAR